MEIQAQSEIKNYKKAIIVGASSGIGKGVARLLSDNNYKVGITGRRTNLLNELRNEKPGQYFVRSFDITNIPDIKRNLNELVAELGGLDLLVLSAGTGDINETLDFEIEKRTIDTNVSGFTAIADWAFNFFEKQNSGYLAAISSIGGLRGNRQAPSYSASKAYQINYLEGLRQKASKTGFPIYITDIRPGFVNTDMAKGDGIFWLSDVTEVSKQIYEAILAKRKIVYVSKRWKIIAVLLKFLPNWIFDKM